VTEGLIDTNVFIHSLTRDPQSEDCRAFLVSVARGETQVRLEFPVLHELSYALPRRIKQMDRMDVVRYLTMVINWPGVKGDKATMLATVDRWSRTPGLAFVDAYLSVLALDRSCPVYSKNARELRAQGVIVPDPLLAQ
jgi:predicted nucleic acid-binding protein